MPSCESELAPRVREREFYEASAASATSLLRTRAEDLQLLHFLRELIELAQRGCLFLKLFRVFRFDLLQHFGRGLRRRRSLRMNGCTERDGNRRTPENDGERFHYRVFPPPRPA